MKTTKHYTGHRWTTEEMAKLMQMWAAGESLESIQEALNITQASVLKTVQRLRNNGIPLHRRTKGHKAGRRNQPWTQGDMEYLLRRRIENATCEEIAIELGRTWTAVNCMIQKLRSEDVPVAMRGNGVRRLWNAESLKSFMMKKPEELKVITTDDEYFRGRAAQV